MEKDHLNRRPDYRLLVIGGSAGSLDVLLTLLPDLHADLPLAVVVVTHRKNNTDSVLVELCADRTTLRVKEAEDKEDIRPGTVYLAPADYHLLIEKNFVFSLDASEKELFSRPSINATFETAAEAYGSSLICLLLSGANADGAAGLKKVKEQDGFVMVQNPNSAIIAYMPRQALDVVAADRVIDKEQMAAVINELGKYKSD